MTATATATRKQTAWLYYNNQPIQAVMMTEDMMTDEDVRRKMLAEVNSCPGIFCSRLENPGDRRLKIHYGEIKYF